MMRKSSSYSSSSSFSSSSSSRRSRSSSSGFKFGSFSQSDKNSTFSQDDIIDMEEATLKKKIDIDLKVLAKLENKKGNKVQFKVVEV